MEAGLNIQASDKENLELPIFDMVTISRATNIFCCTYKIGDSGFGSIYKGVLSTGKEVAVKRFSTNSKQGLNEFKSEVILIAKLQHRNLVRLLGCCIRGEERTLIYKYMPNGSLDSCIFGRRLDIYCWDCPRVLYLHQDSRLSYSKRSQASNVLLDCEMNSKISDFGLAKDFGVDQSSAITKRVVGTYGYMSPEYAIGSLFSMKSNVFSFGVIALEILSAKGIGCSIIQTTILTFLDMAWTLWIEGKACELLDPLVEGSFPMSEILRCIQVGLLCVQKCPEDRPTMLSVFLMLITKAVVLLQPKQPDFYTERKSSDTTYLLTQGVCYQLEKRLLGCCIHGEERTLIYEYMPNGSLDSCIFGNGYMSPEYAIDGLFSMKSNVFSFRVIVLEILSAKGIGCSIIQTAILTFLDILWIEGKAYELLDPLVEGSFPMSEILRCIQVGLLCVQKCPEDRPTMLSVFLMLITKAVVLPQPKQPDFYTERKSSDTTYLLTQGAYGGKTQYVKWAWEEGIGLNSLNDSFFFDPSIRHYFKNHVKACRNSRCTAFSKGSLERIVFAETGINEVLKAYRTSQEPSVLKLKEPTLDEITHALVGRYNLNFTRQDISSLWFLCKQEASLLNITDQACALFTPSEVFNIPLLSVAASFVAEDISKNASKGSTSEINNSKLLDETDERTALPSVPTALLLALGIGLCEALAMYLGAGLFLNMMGISTASPMHIPAQQFLELRAIGAPAVVLSLAIQGIFRGFKDTKTPVLRLGLEDTKTMESETNSIDRAVANLMFSKVDSGGIDLLAAVSSKEEAKGTTKQCNYSLNQPQQPHWHHHTRSSTGDAEVPIFG
ncbi:unnamed protein product [Camellia sinensis]